MTKEQYLKNKMAIDKALLGLGLVCIGKRREELGEVAAIELAMQIIDKHHRSYEQQRDMLRVAKGICAPDPLK